MDAYWSLLGMSARTRGLSAACRASVRLPPPRHRRVYLGGRRSSSTSRRNGQFIVAVQPLTQILGYGANANA